MVKRSAERGQQAKVKFIENGRPFQAIYDQMAQNEQRLLSVGIKDGSIDQAIAFMTELGHETIAGEAKRSAALSEIATYYGVPLERGNNIHDLLAKLRKNPSHANAFFESMFYAAWTKGMVSPASRHWKFKSEEIKEVVQLGGPLKQILGRAVKQTIGFMRVFSSLGDAYVFQTGKVRTADDLDKLDDIEARLLMDTIIRHTDLPVVNLDQLQTLLGVDHSAIRERYEPPPGEMFEFCGKALGCGHECKGVRGESQCLPCLNAGCI